MRTTHNNVETRIESLQEKIDEILKEVNSRSDLNIDQIIDRGDKLKRFSIMQSALIIVHVKQTK